MVWIPPLVDQLRRDPGNLSILRDSFGNPDAPYLGLADVAKASELGERVVEAIALCRYTPSPHHRQRLSAALGIAPEQVLWGHQVPVEPM